MSSKNKFVTSVRLKLLIGFITSILILLMFPKGESLESEVNIGSVWIQEDLIASQTFEVLKSSEDYNKELTNAEKKIKPIFTINEDVYQSVRDSLKAFAPILKKMLDDEILFGTSQFPRMQFLSPSSFEYLLTIRKNQKNPEIPTEFNLSDFQRIASNTVSTIYRKGLLNKLYNEIGADTISIRDGKFQREYPATRYYDRNGVDNLLNSNAMIYLSRNAEAVKVFKEYLSYFLVPNVVYSQELTNVAKEIARESVSKNIDIVTENERIVAKHDRITPEIKRKIDSYRISKGNESTFWNRILQSTGKLFHIIIIFSFFSLYLSLFRKEIFDDNVKILFISIIVLLTTFFAYIVSLIDVSSPIEWLIFIPVGSMLLTIFFDSRIGFYGTVIIALVVGALRGNDYVFAMINIFAGGLASYTVRDIKNRTQIFRSFLFILFGYIVGLLAFGFEQFATWEVMLVQSAFAGTNALISPILTFGLIIFFEKIFKFTTDLTLLELTDFNTGLLKNLAKSAPGTFTHSMTIGNMVENAAEVIGASPILARVGAYYHDIGKTFQPDTFVENQMGNENVHDALAPIESASRIIDHVTRGIELAKENNLPEEIVDFIPMHHGTQVIKYFYEKEKAENTEKEVLINNFRYPGPKPNSKETALVMLADACESAVRSMVEPTPEKIDNLITNLIKARVDDGQLDEAPITFADLKIIKNSFYEVLVSQHHKRIRYPKQDEMENESTKSPK